MTDIFEKIRETRNPVVVYGAYSRLTEPTLFALREKGIEPLCLADGRLEVTGTRKEGLEILSPDQLVERYPDADVFICLPKEFWTVWDILAGRGMTRLHDVVDLLRDVEAPEEGMFGMSRALFVQARETHERLVSGRRGEVSLPYVNFVVTERCTLKCRACNELMPMFCQPRDYGVEALIRQGTRLLDALDVLVSATIVGGEPLLYRDLPVLIRELAKFPKIHLVDVVTNGTLLPDKPVLESMAECGKAHVVISDYGPVSKKVRELKETLTAYAIPHDSQRFTEWIDLGGTEKRNRTRLESKAVFRNCLFKMCPTILDGKCHRCARAAFGYQLGHTPASPRDYINLDDAAASAEEIRRQVQRIFLQDHYPMACDYCDGGDVAAPSIPAGEQASR